MTRGAFITDCLVEDPVEGAQVVAGQWLRGLPTGTLVLRRRAGAGGLALLLPPGVLLRLRRERLQRADLLLHSGLTHALLVNALLLHWVAGVRVRLVVLQWHRRPSPVVVRLLRGSTEVVVANELDRALVVAAGLPARVLEPVADGDRVSPLGRAEARRALGLPSDVPVFLHVGHGTPGRNLAALAPLADGGLLVLVLSPYSPVDPAALPEDPRVRVIHERVDVATWYRAADVYLFPTVDPHASIAVPMSVVEARASGLPVVARRSPLTERWADDDGVLLVDDDEAMVAGATTCVQESVVWSTGVPPAGQSFK